MMSIRSGLDIGCATAAKAHYYAKLLRDSGPVLCDDTHQYDEPAPCSHCVIEDQLEACCLRASIRHAYRHLFVNKKAPFRM